MGHGHVQHPPEAGGPSHEPVLPAAGGLPQDTVRNILFLQFELYSSLFCDSWLQPQISSSSANMLPGLRQHEA